MKINEKFIFKNFSDYFLDFFWPKVPQ